ncbi:hypothetical protein [Nocardia sp. SYP-A9097]|uniref:MmyB family transcriptional regulator n=1 Tax=Nocardia sp. SYP-A9097 TaxID=2663237 RepID=UPI00129A602F|nr:hypothetical protein [Nocardia sp. SYP-A9097]
MTEESLGDAMLLRPCFGMLLRRHLIELSGTVDREPPTVAELQAEITTDMRNGLELYRPKPTAYLDTRLNVLACNENFAQAFPGLTDGGNLLCWLLNDERSRQTMVEWEDGVRFAVQWWRGLLGQVGEWAWSAELVASYGEHSIFRESWNSGHVTFHRVQPALRLRDLGTGEERVIVPQVFRALRTPNSNNMLIFLGLPI